MKTHRTKQEEALVRRRQDLAKYEKEYANAAGERKVFLQRKIVAAKSHIDDITKAMGLAPL